MQVDVKHRVIVVERIEAGVIAERAFACAVRRVRHSLRARSRRWPELPDRTVSHFTISTGLPRIKPAIIISSMSGGSGRMAEYMVAGIGADRDRDVHACSLARLRAGGGSVRRPACASASACRSCARRKPACGTAAVALARVGIAREHHRQRDEAAAILRPAVQDRKIIEREILLADDFLARAVRYDLRERTSPSPPAWAASSVCR